MLKKFERTVTYPLLSVKNIHRYLEKLKNLLYMELRNNLILFYEHFLLLLQFVNNFLALLLHIFIF